MTIQEIENRFCIPAEKLERYEACGLITGIEREDGARDYSEDEISELGLICIFTEAGFTCGEIRQYFALGGTEDGNARQIRMLRKKRGELLERTEDLNDAGTLEEASMLWNDLQVDLWEYVPVMIPGHYSTIYAVSGDLEGVIISDGFYFWNAYRDASH